MIWLAVALACSSPDEVVGTQDPAATGPVDGDTLVIAVPFDPGILNPLVAPYALSGWYTLATQPGLVERKITVDGLVYEPKLAESFAWSEDGRSLTYVLQEGLTWDDGTPLTTADVVFTQELIADPAVASNWHGDAKQIERIEVHDERSLTFHFVHAGNPIILQGATMRGIVPQHVLESADRASMRGHPYSKAPSASGPWKVGAWSPGETLVLEPNTAQSVFPRPHLDRIVTRVIPEYSTRLLELQNGTNDMVVGVETHDVPHLKADYPHIRLIRSEAESMQYLGYNMADPHFADARVRRAMSLAIDRDKLVQDHYAEAGEVYARPCVGTVGPTLGAWHADEIEPLPHDVEQARKLLAEAGWADANGDGVLERDGEPFQVEVIVQNGVLILKNLSVSLQAQLKAVGIDLQIRLLEPNRFSQLARDHQFEVILWSFGNNPKVDPYIQWHTDGQYNWMQYSDPETDRLLQGAREASSMEEAQRLVREAQVRVYDAQPATFLFWEDEIVGIHERFRDTKMNTFTVLEDAERWWVPAAEQKY